MGPAGALAAAALDALGELGGVEVRRVVLPLRQPHVAAHGRALVRDVLVVGVADTGGRAGWGECPTFAMAGYTDEDTAAAWRHLCDHLVPALLDGTLTDRLAEGVVLDPTFPMASGALESALVDLGLRRTGDALAPVLGATTRCLPRCVVLSLPATADDAALVAPVGEAVAAGASMVKLKVDPVVGVAHVVAVRQAFPSLSLAVDANGSLGASTDLLAVLADLDLAYIEQPLPPGHPDAARVAAGFATPVALDESATGPAAVAAALAAGEGSVVNLKPARVGGLAAAVRCWEAAAAGGAGVFVGGMVETAVGRAAAVGLAAAVGSVPGALPTDLGPSAQYFERDLAGPVVVDEAGALVVPGGPGIGVTPDPALLDALTTASWWEPGR